MESRQLDLPVDGGDLRVLLWGTGQNTAVAVHGITASAMAWQALARQLPADWTLATPDLRGRGHSNGLPGPFGLDRHVADIAALLASFEEPPVLVGHSLGAFIALLTYDAHPGLARRLVLLDGGLSLPLPEGTDLDAVLDKTLGPALARLRQTFADERAYLDFWHAHPAFAEHWTADVEAYVRYDLQPADGSGLRSRAVEDAVRADGRDLLLAHGRFAAALEHLGTPTTLLTAEKGLFGEPPGFQPPELVDAFGQRAPRLRPERLPDVNHYTMLFEPNAVREIAKVIAG